MRSERYTETQEVIFILYKDKSGRLLQDSSKNTPLVSSLKAYRRLDDNKSIKEWYQDSIKYAKQHPVAAFMSILSVFFGLTQF